MVYFISFIIPAVVWLLGIVFSGIFPFGDKIIFTSDMAYQYAGYFEYIQNVLTEGVSPLFSFYKGMGEETLGMITYYMLSPFNLILAFFSKANITEAVLLINLLKISTCGLTFSIFLKNTFKKNNNFAVVGFSTCYALMAYNIAYQFNIMWIDGVIWLPIIILGINRIIEKDKSELFYISLTVAIISNWYIGFMLCIISGMWLMYKLIINENSEVNKRAVKKFLLFGVLSAGTALVAIFPAVLTCINEVPRKIGNEGSAVNYTLVDIFSKFVIGSFDFWQITDKNTSATYLNLPNLFAGVTTLFLFIIYFFNDSFDKKKRLYDGIFFGLLISVTLFDAFNKAIHGFTYNVWFPYRYSFCISFYMLYIAYKSFCNIDGIELKKILKVLFYVIIGYFVIEKLNYTYLKSELIWGSILILIAGYITLKLIKKGEKKAFVFLSLIMCVEIFLNTVIYLGNFQYSDRNKFYADRATLEEKVSEIKEKDEGYYRIENDIVKDYNAYMGRDYMGITTSSTMGKESVRGLLESLGYTRVVNNSIQYSPATRFSDNFLGIKYYISGKEIKENKDALSVGFLVDNSIMNIQNFITKWGNHSNSFEKQNELIKGMTGINENLYEEIKITNRNLENLEETSEKNIYTKIYPYSKSVMSFSFMSPNEDSIYIKVNGSSAEEAKLYVNGKEICDYMTRSEYGVVNIGNFSENTEVNIDIEFISIDKIKLENLWIYYENQDVYSKVINKLKENELKIFNVSGNSLEGEIKVLDNNKMLLFSIPYDMNLRVFVDDKEVKTNCAVDSLLAVSVNEGEHTVKVDYYPRYLIKIIVFSALFAIFATIIIIAEHKRRNGNES